MSYILAVIDMQHKFKSARNIHVIKACLNEIKHAKKQDLPIVIVEYLGYGRTIPSIYNLLKDYNKVYHVIKSGIDGAPELYQKIKHINYNNIRMIGIETDVCVQYTAVSLRKKKYNVDLVKQACYTSFNNNEYLLNNINKRYKKINVICQNEYI
jgi:nicotinamidase-related amidase